VDLPRGRDVIVEDVGLPPGVAVVYAESRVPYLYEGDEKKKNLAATGTITSLEAIPISVRIGFNQFIIHKGAQLHSKKLVRKKESYTLRESIRVLEVIQYMIGKID